MRCAERIRLSSAARMPVYRYRVALIGDQATLNEHDIDRHLTVKAQRSCEMPRNHTTNEPSRSEIEALKGPAVIEFGTDWCGHCQSAQTLIAAVFEDHPGVYHLMIEDGPGRPLGRSFRVKLWPTLIFLKDGQELDRVVRPVSVSPIRLAMERITS